MRVLGSPRRNLGKFLAFFRFRWRRGPFLKFWRGLPSDSCPNVSKGTPQGSQDVEKRVQRDAKRLPEASKNTKKTRFDLRSVMKGEKKATPIHFYLVLAPFWNAFWNPKSMENRSKNRSHFLYDFVGILASKMVPTCSSKSIKKSLTI